MHHHLLSQFTETKTVIIEINCVPLSLKFILNSQFGYCATVQIYRASERNDDSPKVCTEWPKKDLKNSELSRLSETRECFKCRKKSEFLRFPNCSKSTFSVAECSVRSGYILQSKQKHSLKSWSELAQIWRQSAFHWPSFHVYPQTVAIISLTPFNVLAPIHSPVPCNPGSCLNTAACISWHDGRWQHWP